MAILQLVGGLAVLTAAAEIMVRGAAGLSNRLGIPRVVVGLTVVAWGTSAPELVVSMVGAAKGNSDIALGNVVGSNIANVLLILGLSSLLRPLNVVAKLVWMDVPVMLAISLSVWALAADVRLSTLDCALLTAALVGYTAFLIRGARKGMAQVPQDIPEGAGPIPLLLFFCVAGIAGLVIGGKWFVDGAVVIATQFGVSQTVIGLTLVAVGTSLPELMTSVVAAIKGENDIAAANVIGSNIFNLLGVLGLSGLVSGGLQLPQALLWFDLPVMVSVSLACLPIFFTGHRIVRTEGAVLLGYYVGYTLYLFLKSEGHAMTDTLEIAFLYWILPMTVIGIGFSVFQQARLRSQTE